MTICIRNTDAMWYSPVFLDVADLKKWVKTIFNGNIYRSFNYDLRAWFDAEIFCCVTFVFSQTGNIHSIISSLILNKIFRFIIAKTFNFNHKLTSSMFHLFVWSIYLVYLMCLLKFKNYYSTTYNLFILFLTITIW